MNASFFVGFFFTVINLAYNPAWHHFVNEHFFTTGGTVCVSKCVNTS